MTNVFSLKGETALITGGGSGLGLAIARCFVEAGAHVVLVGRREPELDQAVKDLGPLAAYAVFDVSALDQTDDLIAHITYQFGPVSILVNNAGIHLKKKAEDTTVQEFQTVLDTHLLGAFALSRALLPSMKAQQHGNLLFIASMASIMGIPEVSAYAAAKSAIVGLTRTLATELAADGIRVNAIAPGWIESPMSQQALSKDPERQQRVLTRTPMHRLGQPEDIGWAAVYLCSPAARFVTGTLLPVDGGVSIGF
jgi:gluconate 5-dehydrogenase